MPVFAVRASWRRWQAVAATVPCARPCAVNAAAPCCSQHVTPCFLVWWQVICVLYLGLLLYTGRYVLCKPKNQTRLFTLYTRFVCGGSLLRVVYFGVPDTWWGTNFVPSNYEKFSGPWWGNLATFLGFFCVANLLFDATFVLLVYYWASVCEDADALPIRVFSALVSTFILMYLFIVRATKWPCPAATGGRSSLTLACRRFIVARACVARRSSSSTFSRRLCTSSSSTPSSSCASRSSWPCSTPGTLAASSLR